MHLMNCLQLNQQLSIVSYSGHSQRANKCLDIRHTPVVDNRRAGLDRCFAFVCQDMSCPKVPRREFICTKVASKLTQHFKDPLTVCARTMPPWTHILATSCKFLFPLDYRRKYFYCTRVGLPHILKFLLEERKAASGSQGLTMNVIRDDQGRLSRLAQLKVTKVSA